MIMIIIFIMVLAGKCQNVVLIRKGDTLVEHCERCGSVAVHISRTTTLSFDESDFGDFVEALSASLCVLLAEDRGVAGDRGRA